MILEIRTGDTWAESTEVFLILAGKETRELSEVMGMFYILILLLVAWVMHLFKFMNYIKKGVFHSM